MYLCIASKEIQRKSAKENLASIFALMICVPMERGLKASPSPKLLHASAQGLCNHSTTPSDGINTEGQARGADE